MGNMGDMTDMGFWENLLELNPLIQNSVQQNFLPELYSMYPNSYQKFSLL